MKDAHQEGEEGQNGVVELRLSSQIYRPTGLARTHALQRPREAFFWPLVSSFGAPIGRHGGYRAKRRSKLPRSRSMGKWILPAGRNLTFCARRINVSG